MVKIQSAHRKPLSIFCSSSSSYRTPSASFHDQVLFFVGSSLLPLKSKFQCRSCVEPGPPEGRGTAGIRPNHNFVGTLTVPTELVGDLLRAGPEMEIVRTF